MEKFLSVQLIYANRVINATLAFVQNSVFPKKNVERYLAHIAIGRGVMKLVLAPGIQMQGIQNPAHKPAFQKMKCAATLVV